MAHPDDADDEHFVDKIEELEDRVRDLTKKLEAARTDPSEMERKELARLREELPKKEKENAELAGKLDVLRKEQLAMKVLRPALEGKLRAHSAQVTSFLPPDRSFLTWWGPNTSR